MAEFVNPYNFVRSKYDRSKTTHPLPHDRLHVEHFSGRVACILTTQSRITTKSFLEASGGRIYGSSLKGMIRSVAEAIAQACYTLGGSKCPQPDRLCICCRVFGWLGAGNVQMGRLQISDAIRQDAHWREPGVKYIERQALSSPKAGRHPQFYPSDGRKFYYHHDPTKPQQKIAQTGETDNEILIAKANQEFPFTVDFADLTGSELGLLLYALQLEDEWYHKFGKAKPLGFGTVKIAINSIALLLPDRYETWDTHLTPMHSLPLNAVRMQEALTRIQGNLDVDTIWNGLSAEERRDQFSETRIEEFFQQQFGISHTNASNLPHWCDLDHLLKRHDDYNIHYPSQSWFQKNGSVKLPTAEEVEGQSAGDRSKWLKE